VIKHSMPAEPEFSEMGHALESLDRLRFSQSDPIAALIRGVLLRALASSPAALAGALRRYQRLLLHARDAAEAGQRIDRSELRLFTRELGDQLVWWELLPIADARSEIELSDLDDLGSFIGRADAAAEEPDGKLSRLYHILADGTPTLVFTAFRDTVRYLRQRLSDLRIAWCTGDKAGIGNTTLPRATVLGWFREAPTSSLAPCHLAVTDVAAEGLDLQRAARVVHYDLPWTPMRMEQREGRSVRYGSRHAEVQVVQFRLPPPLEGRLRIEAILARKRRLPAAAGLGPAGGHLWRWRAELARRFGGLTFQPGTALVADSTPGLLAGLALCASGESNPLSTTVLWLDPDGSWTEAPDVIGARLTAAAAQSQVVHAESDQLNEWLPLLARLIRDRLASTRSRRWLVPDLTPAAHHVMRRLHSLVRKAARQHQARRLAELERALAFLAGGHSAGEAALIERMADASESEVALLLARLPSRRVEWDGLEVRLTGLILFGPAKADTARLASLECPGFRRHSSISTEP
jgi:hypothetical protein